MEFGNLYTQRLSTSGGYTLYSFHANVLMPSYARCYVLNLGFSGGLNAWIPNLKPSLQWKMWGFWLPHIWIMFIVDVTCTCLLILEVVHCRDIQAANWLAQAPKFSRGLRQIHSYTAGFPKICGLCYWRLNLGELQLKPAGLRSLTWWSSPSVRSEALEI